MIWEIIWFYHVRPVGALLALASTADSSSARSLAPCAWLTKIAEIVEIGVKHILIILNICYSCIMLYTYILWYVDICWCYLPIVTYCHYGPASRSVSTDLDTDLHRLISTCATRRSPSLLARRACDRRQRPKSSGTIWHKQILWATPWHGHKEQNSVTERTVMYC